MYNDHNVNYMVRVITKFFNFIYNDSIYLFSVMIDPESDAQDFYQDNYHPEVQK